jgi:hypothetical protein
VPILFSTSCGYFTGGAALRYLVALRRTAIYSEKLFTLQHTAFQKLYQNWNFTGCRIRLMVNTTCVITTRSIENKDFGWLFTRCTQPASTPFAREHKPATIRNLAAAKRPFPSSFRRRLSKEAMNNRSFQSSAPILFSMGNGCFCVEQRSLLLSTRISVGDTPSDFSILKQQH